MTNHPRRQRDQSTAAPRTDQDLRDLATVSQLRVAAVGRRVMSEQVKAVGEIVTTAPEPVRATPYVSLREGSDHDHD